MKFPAILAGIFLGTFLLTESTHAMSCRRPTPAQHIDNSDFIFYGQIARRQWFSWRQWIPWGDGETEMTFKVLRAYKGVQGDTVHIRYYNDNGAMRGWGFRSDRPTLVFARSVPDAEDNRNLGRLNYCDMITYHGRTELHPVYQDILTSLKPQAPGDETETEAER